MQKTAITAEVSLPEFVDLMRVRKGLTRAEFAARLGVQRGTVDIWAKQGWRVRADRIVQVCSILDIDPKVFLPEGE